MQPPSGDFKNPVESLRPAIQPAASRQAEKAMRTPSAIAAELEDAFVGGKPERELLVLIRELRAAIDTAQTDSAKITVWRFDDAPKDFRELSTNGGDEDWIAFISDAFNGQWIGWMESGSPFGVCDVYEYAVDGGFVRIGVHS